MSLKERINEDLKEAMKARETQKISVLRMLLSELKYAQASKDASQELPDAEVEKVVSTYHKRLAKALEDFPEGEKRDEIRAEMNVIEAYLPKKAGPEEVERVVDRVLAETEERNFGPLMKKVLGELGSAGDGKLVNQVLKQKLS